MSCNGCRVLRKGCAESCVLRTCLQWIEGAEAQGHATVFVAKFFGRAGLMSFVSNVQASQRPALFRSLLYEACGRTINPVGGAVGLLWSRNWHLCEAAVETVLRGGSPLPLPAEPGGATAGGKLYAWPASSFSSAKRRKPAANLQEAAEESQPCDLDLCLTPRPLAVEEKPPGTPPEEEEASVTSSEEIGRDCSAANQPRLLNLFV